MQEQYGNLKREYPDCILLFRLGDFYEGFNEDAKLLSKVLGLTLTGRGEGENRTPMAGIPYHALKQYLPKLIKAGHKVAIADQLEDPKPGQIVKRDVTKVITAGTIIDENVLDDSSNNYLASIYRTSKRGVTIWGLAFADISTGEFKVTEYGRRDTNLPKELLVELFRIRAAELIMPSSLRSKIEELLPRLTLHDTDDSLYFENDLLEKLLNAFKIKTFKAFGLEDLHSGLVAAAKLYEYLVFNRKSSLPHIVNLQRLAHEEHMLLDEATIRNLELIFPLRDGNEKKTLYGVLNKCQTPMGQRKLRQWLLRPLIRRELIEARLKAVNDLYEDTSLLDNIRNLLNEITDLERVLAKVAGRSANARDLNFLRYGLSNSVSIIELVQGSKAQGIKAFLPEELEAKLLQEKVETVIAKAIREDPAITITEGDIIRAGYSSELDALKNESVEGKEYIRNLEATEIKNTGISSLKVKFNKVFGYFLEVSKSNLSKVPSHYIRKQTTVGGERYITEELKKWEEKVLGAQEKINQMEYQLFEEVRSRILEYIPALQLMFETIAQLDVLTCFAHLARQQSYVRPVLKDEPAANTLIHQGRHPVVETFMPGAFVPNDISFNYDSEQVIILTGPNMSGKSTYIRQVALIFIMAQIGSFVPASKAELLVADRIFTRVGASDNLAGGESTFMVEMAETANILNNASERSLVVLDEVGRGTSTYDGVAIAWAIVEHLAKHLKCRTLFATHYHELLLLEEIFANVRNFKVEVLESHGDVSFMHRIVPGGIDKSYGIHVAGLAGVPSAVINRALHILNQLQKRSVKSIVDKQLAGMKNDQLGILNSSEPQKQVPDPKYNELIETIKTLDINNLSPIEALTRLKQLQDSAHELK